MLGELVQGSIRILSCLHIGAAYSLGEDSELRTYKGECQ